MPCSPPAASLVLAFLLSQQPAEAPAPDAAAQPESSGPIGEDRLPRLLLSVAPVFPPERSERCTVAVEIEVAEDGRVSDARVDDGIHCTTREGIPLTAETTDEISAPYEDATVSAMRRRIYEPAWKDGKPVAARVRDRIRFDDVVARYVYAAPPATMGPKIASVLEGAFEGTKPLASGDGFLIRLPKRKIEGRDASVGVTLRYGEEPDETSTWVVATANAVIFTGREPGNCSCSWFLPPSEVDSAKNMLAWLSLRLGMEPAATSLLAFAGSGSGLPPSGLLEPQLPFIHPLELAGVLETHDRETGLPYLEGARLSLSVPPMEPPEKIRNVDPVFPRRAWKAGISGRVILQAVIDERGDVGSVRVLRGHPQLAPAAVDAVCCWKYKPAKANGKPVAIEFMIQVDFSLPGRR